MAAGALTALRRLRDEEDGFTLIELMVVVMILAILIVMGLPTFLGVRARFQDRAAQTDLRNAVLAARILYTDNATFTTADVRRRASSRSSPNMCYVAGTAATSPSTPERAACASGAGTGSISVQLDRDASSQPLACRRRSTCFVILDCDDRAPDTGETTAANCYARLGDAANVTATTPAAAGW